MYVNLISPPSQPHELYGRTYIHIHCIPSHALYPIPLYSRDMYCAIRWLVLKHRDEEVSVMFHKVNRSSGKESVSELEKLVEARSVNGTRSTWLVWKELLKWKIVKKYNDSYFGSASVPCTVHYSRMITVFLLFLFTAYTANIV